MSLHTYFRSGFCSVRVKDCPTGLKYDPTGLEHPHWLEMEKSHVNIHNKARDFKGEEG